jgi:small subunit ribosomal protein S17
MARTKETKQQTESGEPQPAGKAPASAAAGAAVPAAGETLAPPAAAGTAAAAAMSESAPRRVQVKVGKVVSNKMEKTVIVTVENTATHRLYHRYMKRTSKFAAHDAENRCKVGDLVEIVSSRPLSRSKRWRVREIVKRAE